MFTKDQLLQIIPDVPNEFSLEDLAAILNRPRLTLQSSVPSRPANLSPEEEADWTSYTSPEAVALYGKFPDSVKINALRGIASNLSLADLQKSAKDWEAERIKEKYGV